MDEFFKNIKAGDPVIVCGRWEKYVRTVDKITPSGLVKVDGILYRDGYHRPGSNWEHGTHLIEATPEAVEAIRQKQVIDRANAIMRAGRKITYEQAEQIIKILGV